MYTLLRAHLPQARLFHVLSPEPLTIRLSDRGQTPWMYYASQVLSTRIDSTSRSRWWTSSSPDADLGSAPLLRTGILCHCTHRPPLAAILLIGSKHLVVNSHPMFRACGLSPFPVPYLPALSYFVTEILRKHLRSRLGACAEEIECDNFRGEGLVGIFGKVTMERNIAMTREWDQESRRAEMS